MVSIKLSKEDSEAFAKALANPPKPNSALKKALKKYKKLVNKE